MSSSASRKPAIAARHHGELRQLDEERPRRGRHRANALVAAQLVGQLARPGEREQRIARDEEVRQRPHHGTGRRHGREGDPASPARVPARPEDVQAREDPRLRAQHRREHEEEEHRVAASRPAQLQHRGPDDERQVAGIDVAARREEREVEAGDHQRGRDRSDQRRERGLAELVEAEDERDERRDGQRDEEPIRPVPGEREDRPDRDGQRVLGRRAVGLERERLEAEQLAAPDQAVDGVVVRIRRVQQEATERAQADDGRAHPFPGVRQPRASIGRGRATRRTWPWKRRRRHAE